MANKPRVGEKLRARVAARARDRCGCCLSPARYATQRLSVEHASPRARGGTNALATTWSAGRSTALSAARTCPRSSCLMLASLHAQPILAGAGAPADDVAAPCPEIPLSLMKSRIIRSKKQTSASFNRVLAHALGRVTVGNASQAAAL